MCINAVLFTFLSLLYISDGTYAMTEKLSLVHCRCYTCQLQLCKHILSRTVFMAERFRSLVTVLVFPMWIGGGRIFTPICLLAKIFF